MRARAGGHISGQFRRENARCTTGARHTSTASIYVEMRRRGVHAVRQLDVWDERARKTSAAAAPDPTGLGVSDTDAITTAGAARSSPGD